MMCVQQWQTLLFRTPIYHLSKVKRCYLRFPACLTSRRVLQLSMESWWRDTTAAGCQTARWMWSVTSARASERHGVFKQKYIVILPSFSYASYGICLGVCLAQTNNNRQLAQFSVRGQRNRPAPAGADALMPPIA